MVQNQEVFEKGAQIHKRIMALSTTLWDKKFPQERVVLSSDLFFALIEYTVVMNKTFVDRDLLLQGLITRDELFFETGFGRLHISVDFFSPKNTVDIY